MTGYTITGDVVRISGQLDARSTHELRAALRERAEHCDGVVVDLSEVESVDLVALRMLAALSRYENQRGRRFRLRGCPPRVLRLLHLAHLRGLMLLEPPLGV